MENHDHHLFPFSPNLKHCQSLLEYGQYLLKSKWSIDQDLLPISTCQLRGQCRCCHKMPGALSDAVWGHTWRCRSTQSSGTLEAVAQVARPAPTSPISLPITGHWTWFPSFPSNLNRLLCVNGQYTRASCHSLAPCSVELGLMTNFS
jgi:hypothetical protein